MRYQTLAAAALSALLTASGATAQQNVTRPSDGATPPQMTVKEAMEKTRQNTATRPLPSIQVAVLYLMLEARDGKVRGAEVERMLVVNANPPKAFARSRGPWMVELDGEQKTSYRIPNPIKDVEIENPRDPRSPFSQVKMEGRVPFDLVVPLSRDGRNLGVQRIRIVDTETGQTVVDTPVRK